MPLGDHITSRWVTFLISLWTGNITGTPSLLILLHEFRPAVTAHGRAVFVPKFLSAPAAFAVEIILRLEAAFRANESSFVVIE